MATSKLTFAVCVLACLLAASECLEYKCHHDEFASKMEIEEITVLPGKSVTGRALATELRNFRIMIDYSKSDTFISSNTALTSLYEMSKRILVNTKQYFETHLKIMSPETISIPASSCGIPSITTNAVTDQPIDLYVIINAENDAGTSYFAAASTCKTDETTARPIVGVYYLNFANMKGSKMYEFFYFTTYTHEFMHIIFFSAGLFDKYRDPSDSTKAVPASHYEYVMNGTNKQFTKLKYPSVIAFAQKYYRCPSLEYIPLEDGGGSGTAGSHWEKLFFPEDIMNPTIESPAKISPFTIEMIKASGWYTVVGDPSSYYDWGKDDGCVLSSSSCPTSQEYCPAGADLQKNICSTDYTGKSTCSALADYFGDCILKRKLEVSCLLNLPDDINMGSEEVYGPHSRCIPWHKKDTGDVSAECHTVRCINNEVQLRLKSNITKTCRYKGEIISFGGKWQITCPDPLLLCNNFANRCPMDCNGVNGFCLNAGKCFCFNGFSGSDCGTCSTCKPITDPFITSSNYSGDFVSVDAYNLKENGSTIWHLLAAGALAGALWTL